MKSNEESYFDSLAPSWDKDETKGEAFFSSFLSFLPIKGCKKILDVACGTGVITGTLRKLSGAEVLGVDISNEMIIRAKKKYEGMEGISFIHASFLDFKEKGFDYAVIYNAYPHFTEPSLLAEALHDSLKEGCGFAIVHSLGREALDKHHEGVPSSISRSLGSPEEEARCFSSYFTLKDSKDSKDCFYMLFEAK